MVAVAAVEWSTSGVSDAFPPHMLGYEFQVTGTVTVTSLGAFDAGLDGFGDTHVIGSWTTAGGTALATATLTPQAPGFVDGHFRYADIADVALTAGNYVVAASNFSGADDYAWNPTGLSEAPGITYVSDRYDSGTGFVFPTSSGGYPVGGAGNLSTVQQMLQPSTERKFIMMVLWALRG